MENENQFDHLLIRFILNETNQEEDQIASEWINANEDNRNYFQKLENAWKLISVKKEIDAIDIDNQWNQFTRISDILQIPESLTGESYPIKNSGEVKRNGKSRLYRVLVSSAVAASVIIAFGIGYRLLHDQNVNARNEVVRSGRHKDAGKVAKTRYEVNVSGKSRQVLLQDGSRVLLYDSSELTFAEPFINNSRDIKLTGKAEFSVAKDSSKPFVVYTGEILTKALGTRFLVTNLKGTKNIVIRLYQGKVVIQSGPGAQRKLKRDYYLVPGEELTYNQAKSTVSLRKFSKGKSGNQDMMEGSNVTGDNPSIPQNNSGSWYMFNNQTLSHVFDQLQEMYNVTIDYSKSTVKDKYFIGRFNKSDSLDKILRQIATLNNLKITKEKNKYIISR